MYTGQRRSRTALLRNDAGQTIDRKTKQLLFYECDVYAIKQVVLRNGENFSEEGANQTFEKYGRKRHNRSVVYCLIDRMRFHRKDSFSLGPFRKQLSYREIKHFFVFPSNPSMFLLCVVDEYSRKRTYELYMCKPDDVNTICDLTYKASIDPQNILRHPASRERVSLDLRDEDKYDLDGNSPDNELQASPRAVLDNQLSGSSNSISRNTRDVPPTSSKSTLRDKWVSTIDLPSCSQREAELRSRHAASSLSLYKSDTRRRANTATTGTYSCYEGLDLISSLKDGQLRKQLHDQSFWTPSVQSHDRRRHKSRPRLEDTGKRIQASHVGRMTDNCEDYPVMNGQDYSPKLPNKYELSSLETKQNTTRDRIVIEYDMPRQQTMRNAVSMRNLKCADNVTYISYNSTFGTNISDNGPVYMYISRHPSQFDLSKLEDSPKSRYRRTDYPLQHNDFRLPVE
ncbi:unnamed protein product [Calicophoron daubneyi]|uniref:Trematode PH-like domain-containing protein n=1 Tax=Calicophoron daubneyi TaxID=300641 RepID=A0AAV2TTE2_CALDB